VAKLVTSHLERCAINEPLYDIDPRTGDSVEIFYADSALAKSFGTRPGWFHWSCQSGSVPDRLPTGPFPTSYRAYRAALGSNAHFGKRPCSTLAIWQVVGTQQWMPECVGPSSYLERAAAMGASIERERGGRWTKMVRCAGTFLLPYCFQSGALMEARRVQYINTFAISVVCWSERRDLNSGPPVPQIDLFGLQRCAFAAQH
jgi:hypothetical protein